MRQTIQTLTIAAVLATPAAASAADIDNGRALAEENCAMCHDIGPGGAAKMHPPSFAAIAAYRPTEQILARILYPALHSPMPAWSNWIDRAGVDDLVAYIQSLEDS